MSTQQHKPHTKILPEAELTVPKNFDDDHPISFAKSDGKSVGIVTPQKIHFDTPLTLECDRTLPFFDLTEIKPVCLSINLVRSNLFPL